MSVGGDEALTSREWIDEHVRFGHGPLGALYPPETWTGPNPNSCLKDGDTPSWFSFLRNGLNVPARPEYGGSGVLHFSVTLPPEWTGALRPPAW